MEASKRLEYAERKIARMLDSSVADVISFANIEQLVLSGNVWKRLRRPPAAALAFSALQHDIMQFQVIKLSRYWDRVDLDAFNLPTVVYLLKNEGVERELIQRHPLLEERHLIGREQLVRRWFKSSLASIARIENSQGLLEAQNLRHKFAHNLELTSAEKDTFVAVPKVRNILRLVRLTAVNIERLNRCVRGSDFDWAGSLRISRREANAFWLAETANGR